MSSTMHRFKAYFGMVPLDEYEDDYVDDADARPRGRGYAERDEDIDREYDPEYISRRKEYIRREGTGYSRRDADDSRDDRRDEVRRDDARRESPRSISEARQGRTTGDRPTSRGALAIDSRPEQTRRSLFDEGVSLSTITTLRPRDYSEARTIGERFRDGNPVIMDLVEMSNADAKRLVDFAAGLAFALHGSFDKVATKVFLLSPADIEVSAEDRRKLAAKGFQSR